jgi:hypothetical protein
MEPAAALPRWRSPGGANSVAQAGAVNASQVFVTGFSARACSTLNNYATVTLEV